MDFLIFLVGFLTGILCMFVIFKIFHKNNSDEIKEQMKIYFENMANRALEQNSYKISEDNKEKLEEFFKRFKDRIEDFEKRTEENFKYETENFTKFDMNIRHFIETGNRISKDANSLVSVMKSDNKTAGHWGEIVLERVLEVSGLRKGEEYEIQSEIVQGRPDATIILPDNRYIYIDSKTSFSSWDSYVNSTNEEERQKFLKEFTESTKAHITGLKKRGYSTDNKSPDFVLMFIPLESCYALMFCNNCALWDFAWKNGVMPVSPSTLLAALKVINTFHLIDRQNKNIKEMAEICTSVHDKFAALLDDLLKMRVNLESSLKKLNGKGNIINRIEKLESLGCVYAKKIPSIND